jgi:hypothetical protein
MSRLSAGTAVSTYSNENKMDSGELHKYEIHLLKRIQEQIRLQTEQSQKIKSQQREIERNRKEIEECRKKLEEHRRLDVQRHADQKVKQMRRLDDQRQADQRQAEQKQAEQKQAEQEQKQAEHIARIKCMSEEDKDRIYKQMIKEREDDKRDYILMYGFEKWEKWQRYKLEHDL